MKKKILFIIPSFQIGGTNTAFNNLVHYISDKYDIDVFAFESRGPNIDYIDKYCNILGYIKITSGKKGNLSINQFVKTLKRFLHIIGIDISTIVFFLKAKQLSKKKYECVIAYQEGQVTKFASFIKGCKKIAWVHCDYNNYLKITKKQPELSIYSKYDRIVCVSKFTSKQFIAAIPKLESRIDCIHNVLNSEEIISKSDGLCPEFVSNVNILSIGRINNVKRFYLIPAIAESLVKKGLSFKWYIMGDGIETEKERLKTNISDCGMENIVILIGSKNNPYPYLKQSDVVVSTSLSEACPSVINEAKILGTPVVAADYGSAFEFIEDGKDGRISTIEKMADTIFELLSSETNMNSIKDNLSSFVYNNDDLIKKLYTTI